MNECGEGDLGENKVVINIKVKQEASSCVKTNLAAPLESLISIYWYNLLFINILTVTRSTAEEIRPA